MEFVLGGMILIVWWCFCRWLFRFGILFLVAKGGRSAMEEIKKKGEKTKDGTGKEEG
ncbi:hypothetical protein [Dehalobacter restrictus]|uniref:Uncharacterized protein n=1 Tax=Dehalobacter restrictus TaxID=55583 RepID=A0A857DJJ8_9FIRM|nr:hypothetical protein [Dehalobacter restrictus]QHA00535.1 hypothetical protein GQ588_07775 [Dehalobacter restrictus]